MDAQHAVLHVEIEVFGLHVLVHIEVHEDDAVAFALEREKRQPQRVEAIQELSTAEDESGLL